MNKMKILVICLVFISASGAFSHPFTRPDTLGGLFELNFENIKNNSKLLGSIKGIISEYLAGIIDEEIDDEKIEFVKMYSQVVSGLKFHLFTKFPGGVGIFIIYKDLEGGFSLEEAYLNSEVFSFFFLTLKRTLLLQRNRYAQYMLDLSGIIQ